MATDQRLYCGLWPCRQLFFGTSLATVFAAQVMNHSRYVKFATTRWSLVNAAKDQLGNQSQAALQDLCAAYWSPLYAFARRRGLSTNDAEDITQAFFAAVLSGNWLEPAEQQRGRFRTYLLTLFKRFMAAEWRKEAAVFRGGNQTVLSLQFAFDDAEKSFQAEPACDGTAEQSFDYQWALTVLDRVWGRLRARYAERGQADVADLLRCTITTVPDDETLHQMATSSGKSTATLRVAMHRLRTRYRQALHDEIAETIDDPVDIDVELNELLQALRGGT